MRKADAWVWQEDLGKPPREIRFGDKVRNPANAIPLHLLAHNERIVTVEQLEQWLFRLDSGMTRLSVKEEITAIINGAGDGN